MLQTLFWLFSNFIEQQKWIYLDTVEYDFAFI